MTDWSGELEIRNYSIDRKIDRKHFLDLMGVIGSLLLVAGVLFFHSWVRTRIVHIGYEVTDLQRQEEELVKEAKALILEEETLKSPARIEEIAMTRLGMVRLRPNQVIRSTIGSTGHTSLAMARDKRPRTEP
jgi:cell division protein FtsL